jgi:hypothetical protein
LEKGAFINDAAKIWNQAPDSIKNEKSLSMQKKGNQKFCQQISFVKHNLQKFHTLQ